MFNLFRFGNFEKYRVGVLKYVIVAPFGFVCFHCRHNSPEEMIIFEKGIVDVTALRNSWGYFSFTVDVTALKNICVSKSFSLWT